MALTRDTEFLRATVSQEWREVLSASDVERNVLIVTPASPDVSFFLADADEQKPADLGLNRTYKGALFPSGQTIGPFRLRANQRIFAGATDGVGHVSIIVEYPA